MCRHTDGPWQPTNAFISNKNALKWKCIFCCAINGLFWKSNLSSILCASNVFIVKYIRFGAFDIRWVYLYIFFLCNILDGSKEISLNFMNKRRERERETNEWGTKKNYKHTHTNQMDRNIRVDMAGVFPTFRAVGTSWLSFVISIVLYAKSEKSLTVCYVLGWEMFFGGWNFIDFSFFRASPLCSRSFLSHSHTYTHISSLLHCIHLAMVAIFSCLFSMCLQSYRIISILSTEHSIYRIKHSIA